MLSTELDKIIIFKLYLRYNKTINIYYKNVLACVLGCENKCKKYQYYSNNLKQQTNMTRFWELSIRIPIPTRTWI